MTYSEIVEQFFASLRGSGSVEFNLERALQEAYEAGYSGAVGSQAMQATPQDAADEAFEWAQGRR